VRLDYEMTFDDQLAVDRARRNFWHRFAGAVLCTIFGGICLTVGVFGFLSGEAGGWWVLPTLFVGVMIARPFLNRWQQWRLWRKATGPIPPHLHVEFGEAGVFIASGGERTFLEWDAFSHYRETSELFLLYQGPAYFRFFPKRAFEDSAALALFRGLLAEKVGRIKYRPEVPAFPVVASAEDRSTEPAVSGTAEPPV
jgi:hypothetical protein